MVEHTLTLKLMLVIKSNVNKYASTSSLLAALWASCSCIIRWRHDFIKLLIKARCFVGRILSAEGDNMRSKARLHLGFSSRGANATIAELRGGGAKMIVYFPSVKNDIELINLIILGGLGVCSPRKVFLICFNLELWDYFWWFLSTQMGKIYISIIHWFPSIQIKCCKDVGCISYCA